MKRILLSFLLLGLALPTQPMGGTWGQFRSFVGSDGFKRGFDHLMTGAYWYILAGRPIHALIQGSLKDRDTESLYKKASSVPPKKVADFFQAICQEKGLGHVSVLYIDRNKFSEQNPQLLPFNSNAQAKGQTIFLCLPFMCSPEPESLLNAQSLFLERQSKCALSTEGLQELHFVNQELLIYKGLIEHELTHIKEKHPLQKDIVFTALPFVMHGIGSTISSLLPLPSSTPLIVRSLLKIPSAYALSLPAIPLWFAFIRYVEYRADDGISNNKAALEAAIEKFKRYYSEEKEKTWNDFNHPTDSNRIARLQKRLDALEKEQAQKL